MHVRPMLVTTPVWQTGRKGYRSLTASGLFTKRIYSSTEPNSPNESKALRMAEKVSLLKVNFGGNTIRLLAVVN